MYCQLPQGPLNTVVPSDTDIKVPFSCLEFFLSHSFLLPEEILEKNASDSSHVLFCCYSSPFLPLCGLRTHRYEGPGSVLIILSWVWVPGLSLLWIPTSWVLELLSDRQRWVTFIQAEEWSVGV